MAAWASGIEPGPLAWRSGRLEAPVEFRLALLAIQLRAYVSKREGARLTMKDRPSHGMGEPRAGESFVCVFQGIGLCRFSA